jgi:hypothetical protein
MNQLNPVRILTPVFHGLGHSKDYPSVRPCINAVGPTQLQSWRITPYQLCTSTYSVWSYLLFWNAIPGIHYEIAYSQLIIIFTFLIILTCTYVVILVRAIRTSAQIPSDDPGQDWNMLDWFMEIVM